MKKKKCSKCKQSCGNKKVIKPTSIEFHRYTTTNINFGGLEDSYQCQEMHVPTGYDEGNMFAENGFDFAIVTFDDHKDGYYATNCSGIKLHEGTDTLKKYKRFSIFGYPGKDYENAKKDLLYGYAMKSNAEEKGTELIQCKSYGRMQAKYVLRQRYVDTSAGQSGSAVFVKTKENEVIIFGVHVGGHQRDDDKKDDYTYNRATLLCSQHIRRMQFADPNLRSRREYEKQQILKIEDCEEPQICVLNMKWANQWRNFIHGQTNVIPKKIDNSHIHAGNHMLKDELIKDTDYLNVPVKVWSFLIDTYGGGPKIDSKKK
eukprot:161417_1